jgi:RecA/RadA recombinase
MAKKPEFDLESFLDEENKAGQIKYIDQKFIVMDEEFQKALGLPGIPLGDISMGYGLSDSNKTEFMLHIAKAATKQNVLVILIITENKFKEDRLVNFGLNTSNCLVKRNLKYLEEVYDYISQIIHKVKKGLLKKDVIILWDSVASTPSQETMEIDKEGKIKKKYGPQKNAAVIGYYNPIIMDLVTTTREEGSEYQVGLYMVNQAYVKPPEMPGLPATIVPNGGEKIWYNLSLSIEHKEGQRLKAKKDGVDFAFGMVSRIKTVKNHINGLYGENKIVFVDGDIIPNTPSDIEKYKKENRHKWSAFETVGLEETE